MTALRRASLLASFFVLPLVAPAAAQAGDLALDGVILPAGDSKITFKHIDIVDTNLTRDEATRLFSGAVTNEEAAALLAKLKAARIAIPEATMTSDKPGAIVFHDIKFEGVDQGGAAHLTVGAMDAHIPADTGGDVDFKSQALSIDGAQVQHLPEAIRSREATNASVRIAHLSWAGFDMTVPDKDTPATAEGGNLVRLHLNSASGDETFDGDTPLKNSLVLNGLILTLPKSSQGGAMLTALGYDKIETSIKVAAAYDPTKQTFALEDFSIQSANLGTIGLSGLIGGVDKTVFGGDAKTKEAAIKSAELRSAELRIVNGGALDKAVAIAALSQGKTPEAVKTEWSAVAAQGPVLFPAAPAAIAVSQGLLKFIANGKNLTLTVSAKSPAPKLAELQDAADPAAILAKFDVAAAADGSAPALMAPAAAPPATAAAPAPAPEAAPTPAPAEPQKLSGLAAWNALVGNTVTGKDSDGAPFSEFYAADGSVKQLDDDEVTTGKWAARGDSICFLYSGEKEETCYKVEVLQDIATFTDEDGDGRRYKILKGNAKNL